MEDHQIYIWLENSEIVDYNEPASMRIQENILYILN